MRATSAQSAATGCGRLAFPRDQRGAGSVTGAVVLEHVPPPPAVALMRSVLGFCIGLLVAASPAAHAAPVAPFAAVDANGEPVLYSWINATSKRVTWRQCTVGGTCVTRA